MSKGERTRRLATTAALELATTVGIDKITIGTVAERSGLSKSGLYAHFGSRTAMQLAALEAAHDRWNEIVARGLENLEPGIPRLRGLFDQWLGWSAKAGLPGGCPTTAALFELDDIQGPVRDYVEEDVRWLRSVLEGHAQEAIDAKQFRADTDVDQVAWELQALYLGHHASQRFQQDPEATDRAMVAFDALMDRHLRH